VLTDGTVRGDRTPHDPTATLEEPRERDGVVDVERVDVEVHETGARVEREAEVTPAAHVDGGEARGGGQRGRQDVGRRLAIEGRGSRAPMDERGLVEAQHDRRTGEP
jgi:hypothetical protein